MTSEEKERREKIMAAYKNIKPGTFALLYENLRKCGADGEVNILIGVKKGRVYGSTVILSNDEPWVEGKDDLAKFKHSIQHAVPTFLLRLPSLRKKMCKPTL